MTLMRMVKTPQVGTVSVEGEPGFWEPCTQLISMRKSLGMRPSFKPFYFVLQFVYTELPCIIKHGLNSKSEASGNRASQRVAA